jgi:hypothetical protein
MATWEPVSYYYSGQGVVLIGERDSNGKPKGLIPVGNVSDLKIAVTTSVLEHKESQTGQRGIDLRLTTETKAALSMTIENFSSTNLALALRGDVTNRLAGTATTETLAGGVFFGKVTPLAYPQVLTTTNVKHGTGTPVTLTAYTNDTTAWDYKINTTAGSVLFNDGQGSVKADKLGTDANCATALATPYVTVGATTTLTFTAAPTGAVAGMKCMVQGAAGADAALLNGKAFEILTVTATTLVLNVDTSAKTITGTSGFASIDGLAGQATYTYGPSKLVNSLTAGSTERYMRFEGLNTADGNNPVIVEVFKFLIDPLKELALIGDGIGQFVLEGNVLADSLQSTGSKYFKQVLLR